MPDIASQEIEFPAQRKMHPAKQPAGQNTARLCKDLQKSMQAFSEEVEGSDRRKRTRDAHVGVQTKHANGDGAGRFRCAGWDAEGNEMLAPIWQIEGHVVTPVAIRKRKREERIDRHTDLWQNKWKRLDEVNKGAFGDG